MSAAGFGLGEVLLAPQHTVLGVVLLLMATGICYTIYTSTTNALVQFSAPPAICRGGSPASTATSSLAPARSARSSPAAWPARWHRTRVFCRGRDGARMRRIWLRRPPPPARVAILAALILAAHPYRFGCLASGPARYTTCRECAPPGWAAKASWRGALRSNERPGETIHALPDALRRCDRGGRPQRAGRRGLPRPRRAAGAGAGAAGPHRRRWPSPPAPSPAWTSGCRATPTWSACCRRRSSRIWASTWSCAARRRLLHAHGERPALLVDGGTGTHGGLLRTVTGGDADHRAWQDFYAMTARVAEPGPDPARAAAQPGKSRGRSGRRRGGSFAAADR